MSIDEDGALDGGDGAAHENRSECANLRRTRPASDSGLSILCSA
jgi:hypothetical protein